MKKALLIACLFISVIASGQGNFFWSHGTGQIKYGYLYNWRAVTYYRNISSDGYRVPTRSDFSTLLTYLGGATVAGGKLKEVGLIYWDYPNSGATNLVKFNSRGAGLRTTAGLFTGLKDDQYIKAFDIDEFGRVYELWIDKDNATAALIPTYGDNQSISPAGSSVRLIRNATTEEQSFLDGTPCNNYIGNDLRQYKTVKIGTQVWVSENLVETKYRNGDLIPVVTDNTAWTALTTGARCVYGNNESNK